MTTERIAERADSLRLFADNDPHIHKSIWFAVRHMRSAIDTAARRLSKERADWHDDPTADDWADFHASAEEQFPAEARDLCIRQLVKYILNELRLAESQTTITGKELD